MKTLYTFGLVLSFLSLCGFKAWAFPDTLRHGYTNCTTCHASPAGGGLLNNYGRNLSKELISTWGFQGEEQPLHGLVKIPEDVMEKFLIGGDGRYVARRTHGKNPDADEGFWMQAQLKLGLAFEKIKLIATIGKIDNPRVDNDVRYVSPEYYAMWTPKEEIFIRAGRFEPTYGLRLPDHNVWVRSEPGFVPWAERDTVEFISEGESQYVSLAGFQSSAATAPSQQMTGYTFSFYQTVAERYRLGFSTISSEGQGSRSKSYSLHGTLGFTEKLYSLIELSKVSTNGINKEVSFVRTGYEVFKGFNPIIQAQTRRTIDLADSTQTKAGVGLIWYPRPHFEIMGLMEQVKIKQETTAEYTVVLHYYL